MSDLIAREPFNGTSTTTNISFTRSMRSLVIFNDSDVTFTINGYTFTVKANDPPFDELLDPFTQITIVSASGPFRGWGRG